jgi:hypothetical protein
VSRTVLFLPQNDSHAETAALLEPECARRGLRSVALDMDGMFHQSTASHLNGMTVLSSGLASGLPFYRMSPLRQMQIVAASRPRVQKWLAGVDAVVAFNDGALQRLVLTEARRQGIPTDLVLDVMISYETADAPQSPRHFARQALRAMGRRLDRTAAGAFFPSEVGLAAVDRMHVAGQHSADVLLSRGSRARSVLASGLPRTPDAEWKAPTRVENVLYLTGAFRWHDDRDTAAAQERDLAELAAICGELDLPLAVRVHPRDEVERYAGIRATFVDPRSESMTATIRRSDLVLSIVSTGLIEAVVLGRPSRVLAIHPNWSRYRRTFVADPLFGALRNVEQLRNALAEMAGHVDPAALDRQRSGVAVYVAATGHEACRRIAASIGETG